MSKRDRSFGFKAITGLTILVLAFLISGLVYSSGRKHGEAIGEYAANTDTYARQTQEHVKDCLALPEDGSKTECIISEVEASNEHERAEKDLVAQTEMALWALGMLVVSTLMMLVSALGVWWIRDTLLETRRAVKAADDAVNVTREIGQTQTRAYLDAVKFDILPVKLGDDFIFYGMVHLKNSGQSPANDVLVRVSTRNAPHDQFKKLMRIGAGVTEIAQMQLPYVSHEEGGELILGFDVTLSYDTVFSDIGRIEDAHSAPFSARFHPQDRVAQKMIALGSRVIVVG